jgi:alkylated DNA repair dioxygenase AlkB
MNLFPDEIDETKNWLPQDGEVNYYGKLVTAQEADTYYKALLEDIVWKSDEAVIFGKHYITKRKVAWYGDTKFEYRYSNITKQALPWTPALVKIKALAEEKSGETYNSCLLNLYHTGEEGMGWHSDGEKDLKKDGAIASMSFGAERKFAFKHKETKERVDIFLENGSLLVMKGITQSHWVHRLPPTKRIKTPRVNLTFRTIGV